MARVVGGRSDGQATSAPAVVATGFGIAAGSAVVTASALLAALLPASVAAARLAVVAVSLAVFAASPITAAAAAGTGVLAFLVVDGFLVNALGQLYWHGAADGWRLLTLAVAVTSGFVAGRGVRAVRRRLWWRRWTRWITNPAAQTTPSADLFTEPPASNAGLALHTKE